MLTETHENSHLSHDTVYIHLEYFSAINKDSHIFQWFDQPMTKFQQSKTLVYK